MLVYKYLHSDRIDVLENSNIRFTQAEALNDPFESMPSFAKFRTNTANAVRAKFKEQFGMDISPPQLADTLGPLNIEIDNLQRNFSQTMGMLSLTTTKKNRLMWAHYADSHRGFVIGLDGYDVFFKEGSHKSGLGLKKVKYSAIREEAFPDSNALEIQNVSPTNEEIQKGLEIFFFTKSIDWKYEEEYRIYAGTKYADTVKSVNGEDIYLFNFPPKCVKEIIFGYRMSANNCDLITNLAKQKYSKAKLLHASLSETEFDLDIAPISQV